MSLGRVQSEKVFMDHEKCKSLITRAFMHYLFIVIIIIFIFIFIFIFIIIIINRESDLKVNDKLNSRALSQSSHYKDWGTNKKQTMEFFTWRSFNLVLIFIFRSASTNTTTSLNRGSKRNKK